MRLAKLKKQIGKSALWKGVLEALKNEVPDEDKLFLEAVWDILKGDINKMSFNDLIVMWAFTMPEEREKVRASFQKMMDDKIAGTLHEGSKDKEFYRKFGIQASAMNAAKEKEEIAKLTESACTCCSGTGRIMNVMCLRCGGRGKK